MLEEVDETTEEAPEATEAPEAPEAAADATPDEPEEQLGPKERRRRERSRHEGEVRPERSAEERAQERDERRRTQAQQRRRWRARESAKTRETAEPPGPIERPNASPRVRQGVVVSDKADKTITVRIDSQRAHKTYGKQIRTSSTLHAHDERNEAGTGDTVRVVESRPLSKTKRWRLVDILERAR